MNFLLRNHNVDVIETGAVIRSGGFDTAIHGLLNHRRPSRAYSTTGIIPRLSSPALHRHLIHDQQVLEPAAIVGLGGGAHEVSRRGVADRLAARRAHFEEVIRIRCRSGLGGSRQICYTILG